MTGSGVTLVKIKKKISDSGVFFFPFRSIPFYDMNWKERNDFWNYTLTLMKYVKFNKVGKNIWKE